MIRKTKPVDRPIQAHQGCCVHIPDNPVVLDRLICHEANSWLRFSILFGELQCRLMPGTKVPTESTVRALM
jgi:hypothetical protein